MPYGAPRNASTACVSCEKRSPIRMLRSNFACSPCSSSFAALPGSCAVHDVETSTTPGSTTAAANRCSKASARGTQ